MAQILRDPGRQLATKQDTAPVANCGNSASCLAACYLGGTCASTPSAVPSYRRTCKYSFDNWAFCTQRCLLLCILTAPAGNGVLVLRSSGAQAERRCRLHRGRQLWGTNRAAGGGSTGGARRRVRLLWGGHKQEPDVLPGGQRADHAVRRQAGHQRGADLQQDAAEPGRHQCRCLTAYLRAS